MKHRVKLALSTLLITLAGLGLMVAQNWRDTTRTIVVHLHDQPAAALPLMAAVPTTQPTLPSAVTRISTDAPVSQTPAVTSDTAVMHTAKIGETVSGLASTLRNKETQAYQDAIIGANPSLKANPDKLVAGQTYIIPAAADVPTNSSASSAAPADAPAESPAVADAPKVLHYTAQPGDTVTNMAGAFLNSPDQAHRDTITNANPSLKADPDRVVAGKKYTIPVSEDGLSAASVTVKTDDQSDTQPDADGMTATAAVKLLSYTAKSGDTVSSMAVALLGSDSAAARDSIISSNPSLKRDPDKVLVGQTYSIPAPVAALDPR